MLIQTRIDLLASLAAILAASDWINPLIELYTGNPALTPSMTPGLFTNPTYTGYSNYTLTAVGTPYINNVGSAEQAWGNRVFRPTADGASNSITGYYVTNTGGDKVLVAEAFPAPIVLALTSDALQIAFSLVMPPLQSDYWTNLSP